MTNFCLMSCLVLAGLALACEAKPDCAGLDKATCESTDGCVSNPVTQYQNGVDQRIDYCMTSGETACGSAMTYALNSDQSQCYLFPSTCIPSELEVSQSGGQDEPACALLKIGESWLDGDTTRNPDTDGLCGNRSQESCEATEGCRSLSAYLVSVGARYELEYAGCAEETDACDSGQVCRLTSDLGCLVYSAGCGPSGITTTSCDDSACQQQQ